MPGLYHGKMGVALALFAYSKKYDCNILQDFSLELLEEIYDILHESMPVDIEYGLSGIGLGISILHSANLIFGDLDEILCDVDKKIMDFDPRRITDFSYRTGGLGILSYIYFRKRINPALTSFDTSYIMELALRLHGMNPACAEYFIYDIKKPRWGKHDYIGKPLGIDEGVSYFIIKKCYDQLFFNL